MIRLRAPVLALLAGIAVLGWLAGGWYTAGPLPRAAALPVPAGSTLASITPRLVRMGAVASPRGFRLRARLFGGDAIEAGEYLLPAHASQSEILAILTGQEGAHRFITIAEGLPSVLVAQKLLGEPSLTGPLATPAEGSVLPQTYDFQPGESRQAVVARMQAAMHHTLDRLWAGRAPGLPVTTQVQALSLAAIVEKETGKPAERALVAGLYENRLRQGIMLQADPTIIYPITRGRPLGRRIRQSEITARNGYNTYAMTGLPEGPITNPGEASIAAVLHPARTNALYMVADGTGGHAFADTLAEHNANVARWFALRRARGDL